MDAPAQPAPDTQPGLVVPPVRDEDLPAAAEALLLTSDRPVPPPRLTQALGLPDGATGLGALRGVIESLNALYERTERAFRIELVAGGYRAVALARFAPVLASLHGQRESHALSRAAVETLAIVAYRQPVTRAELEAIRGVSCGEVLRSLLDKRLIDITGRAEELGRPMLYGTTKRFLESFGLASLKDLPSAQDFAPTVETKAARPAPAPAPAPAHAPAEDHA
ncbi:MAG TPA: SMC-Scp complex subunit ScpB [Phycisphaerales bacterium]|nr:SMC-Scp complex subunit ScpB [Phycisphaerales bacterium]